MNMYEQPLDVHALLNGSTVADRCVWIVFSGQTDLPWLRILKRGFRHCFALIYENGKWISVDPMAHYMEVITHDVPSDFNMPTWLEQRGCTLLLSPRVTPKMRPAPIMFFSCVEVCKRLAGIHDMRVITPWQLYDYLNKQQNKNAAQPSGSKLIGGRIWEVYFHRLRRRYLRFKRRRQMQQRVDRKRKAVVLCKKHPRKMPHKSAKEICYHVNVVVWARLKQVSADFWGKVQAVMPEKAC